MNENLRSSRKRLSSNSVSSSATTTTNAVNSTNANTHDDENKLNTSTSNKKLKTDSTTSTLAPTPTPTTSLSTSVTSTTTTNTTATLTRRTSRKTAQPVKRTRSDSIHHDDKSNASTATSHTLANDEPSLNGSTLNDSSLNLSVSASATNSAQKRSTRLRKSSNKFDNYTVEIKNFGNYPPSNTLQQTNANQQVVASNDTQDETSNSTTNIVELLGDDTKEKINVAPSDRFG